MLIWLAVCLELDKALKSNLLWYLGVITGAEYSSGSKSLLYIICNYYEWKADYRIDYIEYAVKYLEDKLPIAIVVIV